MIHRGGRFVDGNRRHLGADEVQPCRRGGGVERDGGPRCESVRRGIGCASQIQLDAIGDIGDVARSASCLGPGEVRGIHEFQGMRRHRFVSARQSRLTKPGCQRRLTLMTEATTLAAAAGSPDPKEGLRAVLALRRLLERLEAIQVRNARRQGWSWQSIADSLEVSKQAVHKKHNGN